MSLIYRLRFAALLFCRPALALCVLSFVGWAYLWVSSQGGGVSEAVLDPAKGMRIAAVFLGSLGSLFLIVWFPAAASQLHRRDLHPRGALGTLGVMIGLPLLGVAVSAFLAGATGMTWLLLLSLPLVLRAWSELQSIADACAASHGEESTASWGYGVWLWTSVAARYFGRKVPPLSKDGPGPASPDEFVELHAVNASLHMLLFAVAMYGAIVWLNRGTEMLRRVVEASDRLHASASD